MQGDPSLRLKYGSAQDDAAGKGQRDLSLPLKNSADLDDAAGKDLTHCQSSFMALLCLSKESCKDLSAPPARSAEMDFERSTV